MTIFPKKIQKVSVNIKRFVNIVIIIILKRTVTNYFVLNISFFNIAVFNVVPWLSTVPGIVAGGLLTKRLQSDGYTVSHTRKIVESVCMITEAVCLLFIGNKI